MDKKILEKLKQEIKKNKQSCISIDSYDLCFLCKKHSKLYMLKDSDWFNVVSNELVDKVICFNCYNKIRKEKGLKKINFESVTKR